ncbi:Fe-S cluster assembly protein SufD [Bradyrhizobium tunisiense]|uniref:Fe-S cluster assembly protein SufD n=1 Tax=Bradyrhizobium tunisiense TaxID=3278709 RepID=UPI0035E38BD3
MTLALANTNPECPARDVFNAALGRLPGAGAVADARARAFDAFERAGLPHQRLEEWTYTDLRVLMRAVLPLAPLPDVAALVRAKAAVAQTALEGAAKLVLVDGVFAPDLSDLAAFGEGVDVKTVSEFLENPAGADLLITFATDPMISLNAAMVTDGVVVTIGDGVALSPPIQIIHVATQALSSAFTRSHLKLGKSAQATLVESFVAADGASAYQVHDAVIAQIGEGANLSHLRVVADAADATNISSRMITVHEKATVSSFNMTYGGTVTRYQGFITLAGARSELSINCVNLLNDTQHGDTTLVIDHAAPRCTSEENFRCVVDDRGHSVFQGRIILNAQKSQGTMMTRALLLSDEAKADNKPDLQIFADDVTCGHAATSGALDDSLLFYLRARGLPEKEAQALLIQAFLGEAIEEIADSALREFVSAQVARWLETRR